MSTPQEAYSNISKFYKSFSGTDTLVFALFPGSDPVVLGSITTITYSSYRIKKPVVNLGRININGITRGTRIFAGTMIFTLINQHWLRDVQQQEHTQWLGNYKDLKADELPLFDIMIISANEYGSYVYMYIYGIDFTDSAQTLSVEDLFTENTFSFVARDVQDFKAGTTIVNMSDSSNDVITSIVSKGIQNLEDNTMLKTSLSLLNLGNQSSLKSEFETKQDEENKYKNTFYGDLYYSTTKPLISEEVGNLQTRLNAVGYETPMSFIYDKDTEDSVKHFQLDQGYLDNFGVYDYKTHYLLCQMNTSTLGTIDNSIVINRGGADVFEHPNILSNIVDRKPYQEQINILGKYASQEIKANGNYTPVTLDNFDFYRIKEGYVRKYDVYSPTYKIDSLEFPIIKKNSYSYFIKIAQDILKQKFQLENYITGMLDKATLDLINQIRQDNGLTPTDIVDQETWQLILSIDQDQSYTILSDNSSLNYTILPGSYAISTSQLSSDFLTKMDNITINTENKINVKVSAICHYKGGNIDIQSTTLPMNSGDKIKTNVLRNAFCYNTKYGMPTHICYVIYPYNGDAYAWTFRIGGNSHEQSYA